MTSRTLVRSGWAVIVTLLSVDVPLAVGVCGSLSLQVGAICWAGKSSIVGLKCLPERDIQVLRVPQRKLSCKIPPLPPIVRERGVAAQ